MAKEKKKKSKMGAPPKHASEKIQGNHLRPDQQAWLEEQALNRQISMYSMMRLCIDFARDAFDKKHGDSNSANALFDKTLGEDMGEDT